MYFSRASAGSAGAFSSSANLMKKSIGGFVREVGNEMKKVSWPKKEQLQESTIVVLVTCVIISVFVYAVDLAFTKIFSLLF